MLLITGLRQILTFKGPNSPRTGSLMNNIGLIDNGAILIEDDKIIDIGKEKEILKNPKFRKAKHINIKGVALPGFVDSHTHSVFTHPRLKDFSMRICGKTYEDIKKAGGGIVSSINSIRKTGLIELEKDLVEKADKFLKYGTTTIEVKSGYGLNFESEVKILKAVKNASKKTSLKMIPTFLGAHTIPPEFVGNSKKYLHYLINEILPYISKNKLAVFSDIFCEKGYFTPEQSRFYLKKAKDSGLLPKIHAEQFSRFGGAAAGCFEGAVSIDHADYVNSSDMSLMKKTGAVAVLLPASNYFLGLKKYPPARQLIDAGVPVALATDFNPGTSPCWNMQFVLSLACTQMKMTPEEALCGATINGACALKLQDRVGSLEPGKQADIAIFDSRDYKEICYYFGANLNKMTIKKGKIVYKKL
ncbi:MAG: imidazolonepropionase [Elusimicrobia bacterium]|nr:imidazolonepropionase [Elusimicrobiota bacterium]